MELVPGLAVTAEIQLERPIAAGAMGSLWEGRHARHGRVAVKFVSPDVAVRDEAALERFAREADACQRLESPHIARLLEHGVVDGKQPFMVIELLRGETLQARIDRLGRLSLRDVGRIVVHVARALSVAHERGIVHRDVKPANIFLARRGEKEVVTLVDFGIALRSEDRRNRLTKPGVAMGSPEYMSPEQVTAGSVDPSYDLWALTVVAYHALTGKTPFTGPNVATIFQAILNGKLVAPRRHAPDLPPALDRWFARALSRRGKRRFRDPKELAVTFAEAAGMPIVAKQTRAPRAALVALVLVAGVVAGFALAHLILR